MEIDKYREEYNTQIVEIINRSFSVHPNFNTATTEWLYRTVISRQTAIEKFQPEDFMVSIENERVTGFLHFSRYRPEHARVLWPDYPAISTGAILFFAVDPKLRKNGHGKALFTRAVERLSDCKRIALDWQCMNPFYGNSEIPRQVIYGSPEGPGILESDAATVGFVEKFGFKKVGSIPHLQADLSKIPGWRLPGFRRESNFLPFLDLPIQRGIKGGEEFESLFRVRDKKVAGYITYFPLTKTRNVWGIYRLEVSTTERGKGVGRLLLQSAMKRVRQLGGKFMDTVTIPVISPNAYNLYRRFGFREINHWCCFNDYEPK